MTVTTAVRAIIYLRLSDLRQDDLNEDGAGKTFADREAALRELAKRLGWTVAGVVVENDVTSGANGRHRPASAFKRRKVTLPDGTTAMRVVRPGFRAILGDLVAGRANGLLAEDLDRTMRDPRDLEDLIDVAETHKINARSLSGSLSFTDGGTDAEITMARIMVTMANKSSRDTSRRVTAERARQARNGQYGGGRRPFGFDADGLTVRPDEADVIADCSRRVLQIDDRTRKQSSLRALAAELRESDVPTVTGAPWSAGTLRDILLRPRNAGLLVYRAEEIGAAPWDAIVPVDTFRAVVGLLTDPSRVTGPGAAPKWLGTGLYLCGKCDDGTTSVQVTLGGRAPRYRCKSHAHLTRNASEVDTLVETAVLERLSQDDAIDLVPTVATSTVDVPALRAEVATIRTNLDDMAEDRALGLIDRAQMIKATERGRARTAEINEALSVATVTSPLERFIDAEDVAAEWAEQSLSMRRIVVSALFTVTILPTGRKGRGFDPTSVEIAPRERRR